MKLPNFCIAGFPKCGTTSLYYYLAEHPDIFLPKQKELHHFSFEILDKMKAGKDDAEVKKNHIKSFDRYKSLYKKAEGFNAVGDVSPSYANYEESLLNIKKTLGTETKIVVVLRDPIKRAYSNYIHLVREQREDKSFYEALLLEEERKAKGYSDFWYYKFNSLYFEKLQRVKEHFTHIYIITFEEFIKNPENGIKSLYEFLEVEKSFVPDNLETQFNPGGLYKENMLTNFIFGQSKIKTALKKIIPMDAKLKQLKIKTIGQFKKESPELDKRSEEFLISYFEEDVKLLKQELGVKTEMWNKEFQK